MYQCPVYGDSGRNAVGWIGTEGGGEADRIRTYSFALGKTAEKLGISKNQIRYNLDKIEYLMLTKFYSFVIKNRDKYWIHWNMTDDNYGFQAIEHRYQCLEFKLYKKGVKVYGNL